jgi:hypothetical protein
VVVLVVTTDYIARIKLELKVLVVLLCALAGNASAVVSDAAESPSGEESPYSSIWLRNVFDLKPVPPPTAPDEKPNEPPPNIHLTGITTILGNKRALFMVQSQPHPGKPMEKEKSYILAEGQRQDRLEVLKINPEAATVKINLDGVVSTITFDKTHDEGGPQKAVANTPPLQRGNSLPMGGFAPGSYHGGHQRAPLQYNYNYHGASTGNPGYPAGGNFANNQGAVGISGGGYNFNPAPASTPGSVPPGMTVTESPVPSGATPDNAPPNVTSAIAAAQRLAAAAAAAQSGYTPSPYSQGTGASSGATDPSQSTSPGLPNFGNIPAVPTGVTIPPLPANYSAK